MAQSQASAGVVQGCATPLNADPLGGTVPTPDLFARAAKFVSMRRRYFVFVSFGLPALVVLAHLIFDQFATQRVAEASSHIAFWILAIVPAHWGGLIAWGWFDADRGVFRNTPIRWPASFFLFVYLVVGVLGPIAVWFL